MIRIIVTAFLLCINFYSQAWNAMGHQLVAQIAYDNLTPAAKKMFNQYNRSYSIVAPSPNFVAASTWLDAIRYKDIHWFDLLHYIDIPFSTDDTSLPSPKEPHALSGIKNALSVLSSNKTSSADKGLSLRILIHVVGDIHQPLHTITKVSKQLPQGDLGGNLFFLAKNPVGSNLHKYWDNGGGLLIGKTKSLQKKNKVKFLEEQGTCKDVNLENNPQLWVHESHQIALTQVYNIEPNTIPSKRYQQNTQNIAKQQIHTAGCRLASLLNDIAKG